MRRKNSNCKDTSYKKHYISQRSNLNAKWICKLFVYYKAHNAKLSFLVNIK